MLERYNEIWDNVKNKIKKKNDSKPVYSDKYPETKMKSFEGKVNTNFHDDEKPNQNSNCIFLLVILIEVLSSSVFRRMQVNFQRQKDA